MTSKRLLTPVKLNLFYAADYIEKFGHFKAELHDQDECKQRTKLMPSVCAMGAINMTTSNDLVAHHAKSVLAKYIWTSVYKEDDDNRDDDQSIIANWNDLPSRKPEEVIAALRAAAMATNE